MAQSYNIRIEETVTETFPVTADSPEDAVSKARHIDRSADKLYRYRALCTGRFSR